MQFSEIFSHLFVSDQKSIWAAPRYPLCVEPEQIGDEILFRHTSVSSTYPGTSVLPSYFFFFFAHQKYVLPSALDLAADMEVNLVADMEVNLVADMEVDMVADIEMDIVANMEVDMVANMEVDTVADMVTDKEVQKMMNEVTKDDKDIVGE